MSNVISGNVTGIKCSRERRSVDVDDVVERLSDVTQRRHCHVVLVVFAVVSQSCYLLLTF